MNPEQVAAIKAKLAEHRDAQILMAGEALAYIEELEARPVAPLFTAEHPPFRDLVVGGSMQRYEVFALDFDGRVWTLDRGKWRET